MVKGCQNINGEHLLRCTNCIFEDDAFKCKDFRNLENMEIVEFAVNSLTSSGVTESIEIANYDALEQSRDENRGMTIITLTSLVFLAIIIITGIGIGIKISFG